MIALNDCQLRLTSTSQGADVERIVQKILQTDQKIEISQLKGGITNQLYLAKTGDGLKLLVRAFGKGTSDFIDRKREFAVHNQLQRIGLAPKLYGQFQNGLVYGYVPGRITKAEELDQVYTMKNVSRRLAQWHASLKQDAVSAEMAKDGSTKPLGDFWTVLEEWVNLCPEGVLPITVSQLKNEFLNLKERIGAKGGPMVMGHCDLLSANILVPASTDPHNGVAPAPTTVTDPKIIEEIRSEAAFIDYEYAIPCPRAFDIANHFQEWQGYECYKERVPIPSRKSEKLMFWCEEYLKVTRLLTDQDSNIDHLLGELNAWWGMPGFYWGVWSAIQSKSSDIEFNYKDYAGNRFQEFLEWKKRFN